MAGPFSSGAKVFNTDLNPMLLGWIDFSWFATTLAYVSADAPTFVLSVNADVTGVVEPGMRIRLTQTTDKFFIVTAVGAFAAGVTPITVYGGTDYALANATISAGAFSPHKKPFGFNASPLKWTETLKDTTNRTVATPTAATWYNPGSLSLSAPIGLWLLSYRTDLALIYGSSADIEVHATLSTANNSDSDYDFHVALRGSALTRIQGPAAASKNVLLAAKTTYFLNAMQNVGASASSLSFNSAAYGPSIIRAVCAYL
jgi:hypothetical protein